MHGSFGSVNKGVGYSGVGKFSKCKDWKQP